MPACRSPYYILKSLTKSVLAQTHTIHGNASSRAIAATAVRATRVRDASDAAQAGDAAVADSFSSVGSLRFLPSLSVCI